MFNAGGNNTSLMDRVLDRIRPQPSAPTRPSPPPVDQAAWLKSVDSHKVKTLTVHDVGLIVFNETHSIPDSPDANDTIAGMRKKVAHTAINADNEFGAKRGQLASTASPIEPSARELRNPSTKAAYDTSLMAARNAFLSANDPTQGATHFNMRRNSDRSNFEGYKIKTQSGPFNNSYPTKQLPSRGIYVNTYGPD